MSDRIIDLEIKVTHLEQSNQELSDAFYQQQKQIALLKKQLTLLQEQFKQQSHDLSKPDSHDEIPPHY